MRPISLCNRKCHNTNLYQIVGSRAGVQVTAKFILGRSPEEVMMEGHLRHCFALVQLSWLSCPLEWYYEDTDSEAEEDRYVRPVLRTLREIGHYDWERHPIYRCMKKPRLLDLVCSYLYCELARLHIHNLDAVVRPIQDDDSLDAVVELTDNKDTRP